MWYTWSKETLRTRCKWYSLAVGGSIQMIPGLAITSGLLLPLCLGSFRLRGFWSYMCVYICVFISLSLSLSLSLCVCVCVCVCV